jgi:hypothetical protein
VLQMPHALGGFGMTPNTIAQIPESCKGSRFLGMVGSLEESVSVSISSRCLFSRLANLKGSVGLIFSIGLILAKASAIRISIPLDLSLGLSYHCLFSSALWYQSLRAFIIITGKARAKENTYKWVSV